MIKHYLISGQTLLFNTMFIVFVILSLIVTKHLVKATTQFETDMHEWLRPHLQEQNAAAGNERQRKLEHKPSRVQIRVLRALPPELLAEISPRSTNLRRFAKTPLVLVLLVASLMVGLDFILWKFAEQLLAEDFSDNWLIIFTIVIFAAAFSILNTHWVNLGVKFYD